MKLNEFSSDLLLLCFRNVPSSFKGSVGKIVYSLEAKLGRSMRIAKKDMAYINFIAKADMSSVPSLMVCYILVIPRGGKESEVENPVSRHCEHQGVSSNSVNLHKQWFKTYSELLHVYFGKC